jgi:hypothetical protein
MYDSDFLKGRASFASRTAPPWSPPTAKTIRNARVHWTRFGKSSDPDLDINYQLGLFMDAWPGLGEQTIIFWIFLKIWIFLNFFQKVWIFRKCSEIEILALGAGHIRPII